MVQALCENEWRVSGPHDSRHENHFRYRGMQREACMCADLPGRVASSTRCSWRNRARLTLLPCHPPLRIFVLLYSCCFVILVLASKGRRNRTNGSRDISRCDIQTFIQGRFRRRQSGVRAVVNGQHRETLSREAYPSEHGKLVSTTSYS